MQLTTTTAQHLGHGSELSMEASAYLDLASYGTISARSADGVSITLKTSTQVLADAIVGWVSGSRYCSDPDRAKILLATFDRLETTIRETRNAMAERV